MENNNRLPESNEDFTLREPKQQYQVTREQFMKLVKVLPEEYHSTVYNVMLAFNAASWNNQYTEMFGDRTVGVLLGVEQGSRSLIYLEVGDLDKMFFFRMDSHTDIVIHEVVL